MENLKSTLDKYKTIGSFKFTISDSLLNVSASVPNSPGIYLIYKNTNELLYIGKSGTLQQNGQFQKQLLRKRINNKHGKMKREEFLIEKMKEFGIPELLIKWVITFDKVQEDLPGYVEALLIQEYFKAYKCLPPWNKLF